MTDQKRRIEVSQIYPLGLRLENLTGRGAFLGLSLSNPATTGPCLQPLLGWASSRFRPLAVLLGDYIERHNLAANSGGDPNQAAELAMAKAEPVKKSIEQALAKLANPELKLVTSRDLVLSARFHTVLPALQYHFNHDSDFRGDVLDDISRYITRMARRGRILKFVAAITDPSVSYILEELAIFSILAEQGFPVQIYPGRHLKTLIDLANKSIRSPLQGLSALKCIELSTTH